ncbi:M1 family metallopeptidase [Zhouia sp. PK063]|uniref:M1 family metallopeptidase n=1 Tax=Zhouia sp. PK063 TaxID=3373602 RepID=UPI0037A2157D
MKKLTLTIAFFTFAIATNYAQLMKKKEHYTKADTLRGSLRKERMYNVLEYHLNVRVNTQEHSINGHTNMVFTPDEKLSTIQMDLFSNMKVDSILFLDKKLKYRREFNAVFIDMPFKLKKKETYNVTFYYSGTPITAKKAPWDGGFDWSKDKNGNVWVATAVQGTGASLWWPNKDHQSDEPDNGMTIEVEVPNGLMDVSNGRFMGKQDLGDGYTRWNWKVKNPINNYDVALNIGDYVHFGETYKGLDLDFYALATDEEKAKKQFQEVKPMLDCFQAKFGEYPFKEDGYKLVETPYLGMEHQSAVAYGNKFMEGYLGRDLSGSGYGMKWDYIIVHESGHEWFGNSITAKDIADMWIHEGFTTYSESVYVECRWGYEAGQAYVNGSGRNIQNDRPIIGDYGVNKEGSGDMYFKGALLLNTLRHVINDDDKWWDLIKSYTLHFKHQTITTQDVIAYFNKKSGMHLTPIFDQYLRYAHIPKLQLKEGKDGVEYRWVTDVKDFKMPIEFTQNGKTIRVNATNNWQPLKNVSLQDLKVATTKFYINVEKK